MRARREYLTVMSILDAIFRICNNEIQTKFVLPAAHKKMLAARTLRVRFLNELSQNSPVFTIKSFLNSFLSLHRMDWSKNNLTLYHPVNVPQGLVAC